jgi:hypothetical protein
MAVKNDVSYPEFSTALKRAYVDVASRQIRTANKPITGEGISVITGVETTEAERVLRLEIEPDDELAAQAQNPLPQILEAWHTDPRFAGPLGIIRDLEFARSAEFPEASSFTDLANSHCPGISPRALLDELIRAGCVVNVGGSGFYRATTRSYVPDPLSRESIRLVAQIIHNLSQTLEINLQPDSRGGKGLFQRTVYNANGLTQEKLRLFQPFIRESGQKFLEDVDNWFGVNQADDSAQGRVKTGVGLFHYIVNEDDEFDFSQQLPMEGDDS